jgi:propionyl-CoA synthetase
MPSRCLSIAAAGMIADGESYKVPSRIDDAAILPEIEDALETIGYGKR